MSSAVTSYAAHMTDLFIFMIKNLLLILRALGQGGYAEFITIVLRRIYYDCAEVLFCIYLK
jgi:hypothetical protein